MNPEYSKKRIAKNSVMLYCRMLLGMLVGLYTSRVVLQTLGVEDYGIWGVVGGIVPMFSFLNAAMSGATSRFLMYEMGKGDIERLKIVFSSALIVHIIIGVIVLVLSETIGVWFLYNKLVIPEGRLTAAFVILQVSIFQMLLSVTQSPYNATIIAHEKMDVYAYVELLHVFLKLGIVYFLSIGEYDKLILYSFLSLFVSIIIRATYRLYCVYHYSEAKFHWIWDKKIILSLTSYSGYNMVGNFGKVCNTQGVSFLINIFFGVALNAANSIANTLSGVASSFVANIITAFRPSIIKSYSKGDIQGVENLMILAIRTVVIIHSFLVIPLLIETPFVLHLWLGQVPDHAVAFCRLILLSTYFDSIRFILVIGVHAVGKVRNMSLMTGILFCIAPFFSFFLFKFGCEAEAAFCCNILIGFLLILMVSCLLHSYIPDFRINHVLKTVVAPFIIAIVIAIPLYYCSCQLTPGVMRLAFVLIISSVSVASLNYRFCFTVQQRTQIIDVVKKYCRKRS